MQLALTVNGAEFSSVAFSNDSVHHGVSSSGTLSDGTVYSLTFEVQDTSIGIRQGDIAKLFQEFQRIEEDWNQNTGGTGLVMNIEPMEKMQAN